jgi:hypothetical protein
MIKNRQVPLFLLSLFCGFLLHAQPAFSQTATARPTTAATATPAPKPARATMASKESLLRADIKKCGAACMVGGSGKISAGTDTTADYTCTDGNCACFGAADCVSMSEICAPDSMGCNDQGCICEEASSGGD